jgi:uncharacterized protein
MLTPALFKSIRAEYRLAWTGIHGVHHWARVLQNGLELAAITGANKDIVQLFAVFHDSRRINEDDDPDHGRRGAKFAGALRGKVFELNDKDFALLHVACADHTLGKTEGDLTVQTCWDADRLDLGRVGIMPEPRYLCTQAAKDPSVIFKCYGRSISKRAPSPGIADGMGY